MTSKFSTVLRKIKYYFSLSIVIYLVIIIFSNVFNEPLILICEGQTTQSQSPLQSFNDRKFPNKKIYTFKNSGEIYDYKYGKFIFPFTKKITMNGVNAGICYKWNDSEINCEMNLSNEREVASDGTIREKETWVLTQIFDRNIGQVIETLVTQSKNGYRQEQFIGSCKKIDKEF